MISSARTGPYTFADFLELVQEDQKADLLDGAIYMASPESTDHNDLLCWLTTILRIYVERCKLGRVTVNKVAFRLTDKTAPEPDLGFIRTERAHLIKRGYVDGAPDVAVEIVSPDSVERDYEEKRAKFESAGVSEYWIIDPDERRATFFVRDGAGFAEAKLDQHVYSSRAIPGFHLNTNWLWQRPLPDSMTIVQDLLAS